MPATQHAVELTAYRLTAPGIGGEVGAMLGTTALDVSRVVPSAASGRTSALKAASSQQPCLSSSASKPIRAGMRRGRILSKRSVSGQADQLIAFVQGIQKAAAVDSHVVPEPWDMPGYEHPVIMAAGTFIQGGSLELSADAPIREPYIAYMQGGLTYAHVKYGVLTCFESCSAERDS